MRFATLSITAALLLVGCTSEYAFTDSVSSRYLASGPRAEFGDELSTPYVLGSEFTVYIEDRERDESMIGWTVRVTNPEILRLGDEAPRWVGPHTLAVDFVADGVGTTELLLIDAGGEIKGSAAAEVRMPTEVRLYATAIAALADPDFRGETPRPQILTGGTASFAVEYLDKDIVLQGSTNLTLEMEPTIVAEIVHSQAVDNHDILQITAGDPGRDAIALSLGKQPIATVVVDVVAPDRIAAIDLIHHRSTTDEEAEDDFLVVAQAYDQQRSPIYGVGFEWIFPGRGFEQMGDVLLYEHEASRSSLKQVSARAAGREAKIWLQAADAEVYTSNDAAFNCNVSAEGGLPAWSLVLLACLGWRRRQRR